MTQDINKINIFELIDHRKDAPEFGRRIVEWDDDRTLMVFLNNKQ